MVLGRFFVFLLFYSLLAYSEEVERKHKLTISAGFVQNKGNINTLSANLKLTYKYAQNGYRVENSLYGLYEESRGRRISERINFNNRFEYKLKPYFVFLDFVYYRNPFQAYEHSVGVGPGVGIYLYDEKDLYLTISFYSYRMYNKLNRLSHFSQTYQENYFLYNIEGRLSIKPTDNLKLSNKTIYKVSDRGFDDYYLFIENSLINKISNRLAIEISYNAYYQNIPVSWRIERWDTIVSTSIQLNF